jgi:hypothetical protein
MNWKFLTVLALIVTSIAFFAGCSKTSEDKLASSGLCDTVGVKYSVQIVNILQQNCYQCHGNGSTIGSGGVSLYTYGQLKAYADNGLLLGDITHEPGRIGMPYLLPKLPDCEINTILAWVLAGAPNN